MIEPVNCPNELVMLKHATSIPVICIADAVSKIQNRKTKVRPFYTFQQITDPLKTRMTE